MKSRDTFADLYSKRVTDPDFSTSTDDNEDDSYWVSVMEDEVTVTLTKLSFERLLQRILKLENVKPKKRPKDKFLRDRTKKFKVCDGQKTENSPA